MEPGNHQLQGRAEFRFSIGYFQAFAKIALHYYLTYNRRCFTGHEELFSGVKEFIRNGGELIEYFRQQ